MGLTQITTGGVDDNINIDSNTLKVDGTNNRVGIGEASPSATLHAKSGTTDVVADFESTDANAWIQIRDNSTTDTAVMVGAVGDDMRLRAGSNERVRIDSSGRVGIGVTTPGNADEGAGLQVRKYIDRNATYFAPDGHYAGSFGYTNNTQDKVWLSVDSEYAKSSAVSAGIFLSAFHQDTGGSGCGSTIKNLRADNALTFSTVATASSGGSPAVETERLRIDGSGNVGIGLTPTAPLHVGGTIQSQTGSSVAQMYADGGSANFTSVGAYPALFHVNGSERMRIDSSGNVGIGTTSINSNYGTNVNIHSTATDGARLKISDGTSGNGNGDGLDLIHTGGVGYIIQRENNPLIYYTNNTERMRIDSSGRLLVGTSSDTTGDTGAKVQIVDTGTPVLALSRNDTSITSGNTIGQIRIFSNDDSGYQECARIAAQADGTFANNDKPTRLVFSTTADGSSTPTERMRIDSSGAVTVKRASTYTTGLQHGLAIQQGSATNGNRAGLVFQSLDGFSVAGINGVISTHSGTQTNNVGYLEFYTKPSGVSSAQERMRIDSSGRLLVGLTSPLQANDKISVDGQVGIGGQRYGFLNKSVNVGSSVTFDIGGAVNNAVFVRVRIKVGYSGNSNYQMHAQYDYITCNYSTSGGTATITNIAQIESGNAQFNTSDWSVSRPADRTVRLTYSPSSGAGTHSPTIYVDGLFSTIS